MKRKLKGGIETIIATIILAGIVIALIIAVILPMSRETANMGEKGKQTIHNLGESMVGSEEGGN